LEVPITIADLGEFGLIDAIAQRLPGGPGVVLGPGDDAAVVSAPDGRVVATTDLLIEGRHFRKEWSAPSDIGCKAAARNLADIAAMGARPTALLVAFAGPGDLEVSWVLDLVAGLARECEAAGAAVVGGDTSSADTIMVAVTALGDLAGRAPVTRGGARPGDQVAVAGTLGSAAAGLALLQAGLGQNSALAELVAAHRGPRPPYAAGPQAAAMGATSMIDVSDGLLADLGHVAQASGVRFDLRSGPLSREPVARAGQLAAAAATLAGVSGAEAGGAWAGGAGAGGAPVPSWLGWILTGGDDNALAATFPAGVTLPMDWTVVGVVADGRGVLVDGRAWRGVAGWEHFRPAGPSGEDRDPDPSPS
jgi:thiamine-monophosphate kinase